eukprot:Colp12_sorted_trinity150504_noHs@18647
MFNCIAVIGKNNSPLYIRGTFAEKDLKFHYIIHTSLDVVEEKMSAAKGNTDMYLGLLYPMEDYRVYGYVTNTKIKMIAVINDYDTAVKDSEIKTFFRRLHTLYTDMVCNPFYTPGDKIESPAFQKGVSQLMESFQPAHI